MRHTSWSGKLFDALNMLILLIIAMSTLVPFLYIIISSFANPADLVWASIWELPSKLHLEAYRYIFSTNTLTHSMLVSIYITVLGTAINLVFTVLGAYPLAQKRLKGRSVYLLLILITMLFSGGMVPTYFVVKSLGMINSLWSLMIPTAINAFNLIIMKNFFQNVPDGIEESAKIDGCNDVGILFRIVLPLSLPAIATFGLFYAVNNWNQYFSAIIYLNDASKWPLQVMLRQIIILSQDSFGSSSDTQKFLDPETLKMAVIVFATVPIMIVYPFLQKHFAKGVMLGSVKG